MIFDIPVYLPAVVLKVIGRSYTLSFLGTYNRIVKLSEYLRFLWSVNKLYKSKTKRGIITVGDDDYLSFSPEF